MIAFDNISAITEVYLGNQNISEVYCCDAKVFPVETPPTPTGGTKFSCVVNGETYTLECPDVEHPYTEIDRFEIDVNVDNYQQVTSAVVGDCCTAIGNNVFNNCQILSSVTISDSVTSLGNNVFYHCYNLSGITIPNSVTSIGGGTFEGCVNLTSVNIPSGLTTIKYGTFDDCIRLLDIVIPASVNEIEYDAFHIHDSGIPAEKAVILNTLANRRVYIHSLIPPVVGSNAFASGVPNVPATYKIYVPNVSVELYKTSGNWVYYADRIEGF